jgi:hypothetical protein
MTPEEEARLRLLSDGILYQMAETFVAEHGTFADDEQGRMQVNGLLKYVRDGMVELDSFAQKQATRDWTGRKEHYSKIYQALRSELRKLIELAKSNGLVPGDMADNRARRTEAAARLAQEFIQHLAAEMLYPKEGR